MLPDWSSHAACRPCTEIEQRTPAAHTPSGRFPACYSTSPHAHRRVMRLLDERRPNPSAKARLISATETGQNWTKVSKQIAPAAHCALRWVQRQMLSTSFAARLSPRPVGIRRRDKRLSVVTMSAAQPDVVICGGGIQGAAIAYYLTLRGAFLRFPLKRSSLGGTLDRGSTRRAGAADSACADPGRALRSDVSILGLCGPTQVLSHSSSRGPRLRRRRAARRGASSPAVGVRPTPSHHVRAPIERDAVCTSGHMRFPLTFLRRRQPLLRQRRSDERASRKELRSPCRAR